MKRGTLMDIIDEQILAILKQNSKLSNKEIGEMVHLTGQAVGNRILKLQDEGIIQRFSIVVNYPSTQYIRFFMDSNRYTAFEAFVNQYKEIEVFHKVSGQACYLLVSHFTDVTFPLFIESLSKWGRYSVETFVADKLNHGDD
ncbi:AsnC family transcriptional regulator [Enterococcus faecium]|nr:MULTISPECIES: AsnC family transcriptional regulator [Enterococcus]MBX9116771.1 winged helix-turn-helix transcriptional regulator [Enterococcus casseliflavus]MBX9127093.1 winged helix-turn-helix transcriptional regulator [Enterococcus casseliflavus]MCO5533268.1 AsnC family transcriptional regulator [Enterococcus faecium]